ncbi:MAG: hypothetical protein ACTSWG_10300 [Candidatus Helarchaeota archaeon]
MFKKIKQYFQKRKAEKQKKTNLKKQEEYYKVLSKGALVLKYIYQDLKKTENKMSRHTRRRFKKQLEKKGKFTEEVIDYYKDQFDKILNYLEKQNVKK